MICIRHDDIWFLYLRASMIHPFDYIIPKTLQEACDLLWKYKERAKVIAGGTDLVVAFRKEALAPEVLVDITRIPELRAIEEWGERICIGGAVTHSEIASSSIIHQYGKILSDAVSEIGSPQIRNLGTIGGNLINASPAGDSIPPLLVLEAFATIVSIEGRREVFLGDLFESPYKTNIKPYEILFNVQFKKLPPGMKMGFIRLARREGMAIARMSVALLLEMEEREGRIKEIRIAVGALTPTPQRMSHAEEFLRGRFPDEVSLEKASSLISEAILKQSGIRPSTPYKRPVVEALFKRAVIQTLEDER